MLVVAYISTAYTFSVAAASFIVLWRHRRSQSAIKVARISHNITSGKEMISGSRFLFQNYELWYWELVERSRKVILKSGLTLVGQETRSYIGLALVIAGMYGIVFSWIKPINDVMESKLMQPP